ncbi:MAG: YfcE family phosphodiesterase [Thermoplasmata archaeon]|nr:MAG: YfcE family phosphodiesterase [Thermoplasmata archaeon]
MMQKMFLKEEEKDKSKIGLISDSHDNMEAIKKAVEIFNAENVELVIHAGDIVSPFTADVFKELKCDMLLIYGNNDGDKLYLKERFKNIGTFHKDPYAVNIHGKNIIVTHEPSIVDALATKYDIVIYGHTHEKDLRVGKSLIINPGECCGYLTGKRSIAILYPDEMKAKFIDF